MNDRFLRACRREPTEVTPVWFMRQAGRYMPEYRKLREKRTLLELCKNPELSCQVTMQPLRLGVDAAILFADILLPLEPMGAPFEFAKGEGPVIGFAGAPFTLASYLVEGGKTAHFAKTKKMMYGAPEAWNALMEKLSE